MVVIIVGSVVVVLTLKGLGSSLGLGIEPTASDLLGKHSATELHSQPCKFL